MYTKVYATNITMYIGNVMNLDPLVKLIDSGFTMVLYIWKELIAKMKTLQRYYISTTWTFGLKFGLNKFYFLFFTSYILSSSNIYFNLVWVSFLTTQVISSNIFLLAVVTRLTLPLDLELSLLFFLPLCDIGNHDGVKAVNVLPI